MRRLSVVVGLMLATACSGKDGPTGPQGEPGQNGAAARVLRLTALPAGAMNVASVTLPPEVGGGESGQPPYMACYVTSNPSVEWLLVSDGAGIGQFMQCRLTWNATAGRWVASLSNVLAGWTALFVVVY